MENDILIQKKLCFEKKSYTDYIEEKSFIAKNQEKKTRLLNVKVAIDPSQKTWCSHTTHVLAQ